jgi:excisionase family DNA binding protein
MDRKELLNDIRQIVEDVILELSFCKPIEKEILQIDEAAEFTGLAKATIYVKCSNRTIPYFKKGKFLYFKRSELKKWIEDGKQFYREG